MKHLMIATLAALLATTASAATKTVTIKANTTILAVSVKSAMPHNCPGPLSLAINYTGTRNADVMIDHDKSVAAHIQSVKANVSDSCQDEITDYETSILNGPVCLSFGQSWGTVYVPVSQNSVGKKLKLSTPAGLIFDTVEQLAPNKKSNDSAVDCSVEPPAIYCCAAMTPSCIACKENARRIRAEWDAACR